MWRVWCCRRGGIEGASIGTVVVREMRDRAVSARLVELLLKGLELAAQYRKCGGRSMPLLLCRLSGTRQARIFLPGLHQSVLVQLLFNGGARCGSRYR